jgi:hypothetical protein
VSPPQLQRETTRRTKRTRRRRRRRTTMRRMKRTKTMPLPPPQQQASGEAGLRLPSTSGDQKEKIRAAIDSLSSGGSTLDLAKAIAALAPLLPAVTPAAADLDALVIDHLEGVGRGLQIRHAPLPLVAVPQLHQLVQWPHVLCENSVARSWLRDGWRSIAAGSNTTWRTVRC